MPTRGSTPTAPVSTYLGWPSQSTVTPYTSKAASLPVGQDRLAITNDRQPQVRHQHRWQRQLAIEAGIIHGVDFPRLLRRIQQGNGYDSFEIGVHHTLDHLALLRELPPK